MKLLLVVLICVQVCLAEKWEDFKLKHGKTYESPAEEERRRDIFNKNLDYILEHDARFDRGEVSYRLVVNAFADLTNEEFRALYTGLKPVSTKPTSTQYTMKGIKLPDSVDWREKNAVTPVKNQGQCGSCWSFSTTGSMEGAYAIKSSNLIALSEQQLVDCSGPYGNQGCNGGLMDNAFSYIIKYGLESEEDYPYSAASNTCNYDPSKVVTRAKSFVDIASGDEAALQEAVADVGPVAIAIDASNMSFQFYSEGVYDEPNCSSEVLDHGVLAVGYGSDSGTDYWIVKNSWGADWGEKGYIKMSRNANNQCGVASQASYPVL